MGAIVGSGTTAVLARHVPPMLLLLGAAILLEVAVFGARRLSRLSAALDRRPNAGAAEAPIGGSVWAGITRAFGSPYLLNVSAFLLLFAITATFLYFEQAAIVARSFSNRGEQTAFFATVDLLVNVLTLGVQLFLTGRIVLALGLAVPLALLPTLTIVGFGVLALVPTIMTIAVFQVLRRAADYGIADRPRSPYTVIRARTGTSQELHRHRGLCTGDQLGAWSVTLLRAWAWGRRTHRWW